MADRRQTRSRSRAVDEEPGLTNQAVEPDVDLETSPVRSVRRSSRRTSTRTKTNETSKSDSKSKREKRSRTSNPHDEPGPSSVASPASRTTKSRRVRFVFHFAHSRPFCYNFGVSRNCS